MGPKRSTVKRNAKIRYHEYQPPPQLASWIKLFWVFEGRSNEPTPETIVADGFPELIVHFRSPFAALDCDGKFLKQPVAVVCGQLTKPLVLHSSLDAGMIGIRFQPNGMAPFLSTPMRLLTDVRAPAEELFVGIEKLTEEVMGSSNDGQRVTACNRFLFRTIDFDRENPSLRHVLDTIKHRNGQISVDSLATLAGTSKRSLELAFQKEVGTSPKMYCRITRFRHLFDTVTENKLPLNWVELALDSGFFDQSHLIRDFRQFAGTSPTTFLAEQSTFAHLVNLV